MQSLDNNPALDVVYIRQLSWCTYSINAFMGFMSRMGSDFCTAFWLDLRGYKSTYLSV